jgi:DNA polymerase (family 10)
MKNEVIAQMFYEMADILEIQNVAWKPQAYRQAARSIEASKDVESIYKKSGINGLEEIPGVGENIAKKIIEFLKTGRIHAYERLKETVPAHIYILMKVPGIGPKKVEKLNRILKITSVKQLEQAARAHRISPIAGFGNKSEQEILESIGLMKLSKERIPLKEAEKIANNIINEMKKVKGIENISAAGSLRRRKVTIRDIDIIASSNQPEKLIDAFTKLKDVKKVLAKGKTKAVIIFKSGVHADLRVFAPKSWGAGLLYNTGSKNYNIEIRRIAIKKGYKLNEYGLFNRKTNKMTAGKTEQEICKQLGVKYLEPEQRER